MRYLGVAAQGRMAQSSDWTTVKGRRFRRPNRALSPHQTVRSTRLRSTTETAPLPLAFAQLVQIVVKYCHFSVTCSNSSQVAKKSWWRVARLLQGPKSMRIQGGGTKY